MTQVGSGLGVLTPPYPSLNGSPLSPAGVAKSTLGLPELKPVGGLKSAHLVSNVSNQMRNRLTDRLLPIFRGIAEVYIIGFMMMDVLAMWVPRIGTSLKIGRMPYDPSQDPSAQNQPFHQQINMWAHNNVKGLNWINFKEEFWREMCTGPGVFLLPTALYTMASRTAGKSAITMQHSALNDLSNGFKAFVETTPLANEKGEISQQQYRKLMADYIEATFRDPAMKNSQMPGSKLTYGEFLKDWSTRWADAMELGSGKEDRKAQKTDLTALSDELQNRLTAFNKEHRLTPYQMNQQAVDETLIHRLGNVWASFNPKATTAEHMPIATFTKHLTHWTDVAGAVYNTKSENLQGSLEESLPKIIEHTRRKLVANKAMFALMATLLTMTYMFRLVFWTQRHNAYAATRLLHAEGQQNPQQHKTPQADGRWGSQASSRHPQVNNLKQPALQAASPAAAPVFYSQDQFGLKA